MTLFSPHQLPLKIVLLLAIFSLVFLNAGGWYLYNLALAALDQRMAGQLWSIGRTTALDIEASGLPELVELLGEDWPGAATRGDAEQDIPLGEGLFVDALSSAAAYVSEVVDRNGLQRLVLMDTGGRVLFDSAERVGFGQSELYLPLDAAEIEAAAGGEETATVAYPVEGTYYKRAYVPVLRYDETGPSVGLVLGIEAGAGQFREMKALGRHLWGLAGVSMVVGGLLLLVVYRTIRKNVMLERSADRARRALEMGQMTAAVAHEIRNPLGIIQTNAECLRSLVTDAAAREAATDILEETERLAAVLHRFTGLLGGEDGKAPAEHPAREVDLAVFLKSLVGRYSAASRQKGTVIDLQVPEGEGEGFRVRAREDLLDSVFQNLMDNALDAASSEGKVSIRLLRAGEAVRVEIEDTGPGMTSDEIEAALHPFHTTKHQGTGIGLPLAKGLVERMGGRLTVSSRRGKGTRVVIEFPAPDVSSL
jgi:signal transduction histidine kinase